MLDLTTVEGKQVSIPLDTILGYGSPYTVLILKGGVRLHVRDTQAAIEHKLSAQGYKCIQ